MDKMVDLMVLLHNRIPPAFSTPQPQPETIKVTLTPTEQKKVEKTQKNNDKMVAIAAKLDNQKKAIQQGQSEGDLKRLDWQIPSANGKMELWKLYYEYYQQQAENIEIVQPGLDTSTPWDRWQGHPPIRSKNNGGEQVKTMNAEQAWKAWCWGVVWYNGSEKVRTPPIALLEFTKLNTRTLKIKKDDPLCLWRTSDNADTTGIRKELKMLKQTVYNIDKRLTTEIRDSDNLKAQLEKVCQQLESLKRPTGGIGISGLTRDMKGEFSIKPSCYEQDVLGWK